MQADLLRSAAPKQVNPCVGKSKLLKKSRLARQNPDSLKSSAPKQVRWFWGSTHDFLPTSHHQQSFGVWRFLRYQNVHLHFKETGGGGGYCRVFLKTTRPPSLYKMQVHRPHTERATRVRQAWPKKGPSCVGLHCLLKCWSWDISFNCFQMF